MKKGDVVYIVDSNNLYSYTTTGSWGYFIRYDDHAYPSRAYIDWQHFTSDAGDKEAMLHEWCSENNELYHNTWDIKTECLRVLTDPPEDRKTLTELVRVMARLEAGR
jgi:hypothetical protein